MGRSLSCNHVKTPVGQDLNLHDYPPPDLVGTQNFKITSEASKREKPTISQKSKAEENVSASAEGNTKDIKICESLPSNNELWLQKWEKDSSGTFLRLVGCLHCLCRAESSGSTIVQCFCSRTWIIEFKAEGSLKFSEYFSGAHFTLSGLPQAGSLPITRQDVTQGGRPRGAVHTHTR